MYALYKNGLLAAFSALTLMSLAAFAEDHTGEPSARARNNSSVDNEAHAVFKNRCVDCHKNMGSPLFQDDGFPTKESLDKVAERIRPGAEQPMPPGNENSLSSTERASLNLWIKSRKEAAVTEPPELPEECYQKGVGKTPVSDVRAKGILLKSCVGCHSDMGEPMYGEMPWTMLRKIAENIMKTQHTLFLNEDGSLLTSHLGDPTESKDSGVPKKLTTIDRMVNQVSGHFMPPKGMSDALAPPMSEKDRKDLMTWLNQQKHRESCPLIKPAFMLNAKTKQPMPFTYPQAAEECEKQGGWVPTSKQLTDYLKTAENAYQAKCFWTSSYSGLKDLSRVIYMNIKDGEKSVPKKYYASPGYECSLYCAKSPKLTDHSTFKWSEDALNQEINECTQRSPQTHTPRDWKRFCKCTYEKAATRWTLEDFKENFDARYKKLLDDGTIESCAKSNGISE